MRAIRKPAFGFRPSVPRRVPRRGARPAFSLLELQVAFVVFGVALTGLCPLVVMQTRHARNLEQRLKPQTVYYVLPSSDRWVT